ncbi:MAG TPA: histidinol-phosphate transaminase [Polyangiales bacterium]
MSICAERVHGGPHGLSAEARSLLERAGRVLDFSVNLNPYGPPRALLDALQGAELARYPDPDAQAARASWAQTLDTSPARIAVGHGAADLLWALARALLAPGDRAALLEPTFSEFRVAAAAAGARVESIRVEQAAQFVPELARVIEAARGVRALYVCAPNNPTGVHLESAWLSQLARALPEVCVVVDQSFLALSDHAHELDARLPDNVVCVRSLTKDFALPGLRIGLLIGAPALVERIEAQRPTWSTSAPAQAAIAAAAREQAFVRSSWEQLRRDRAEVARVLRSLGLTPLPSASAYQLVRVGDAAAFCRQLWGQGVLVRDCSSFGLPEYVRIAARPEAEVAQWKAALAGG